MGTVIIVILIVLAAWNAVRTVGRQKKRMKDVSCPGDCASCETPCQAKRICYADTPKRTEKKK